jgi:hypothetical protein
MLKNDAQNPDTAEEADNGAYQSSVVARIIVALSSD